MYDYTAWRKKPIIKIKFSITFTSSNNYYFRQHVTVPQWYIAIAAWNNEIKLTL